MILRPELPPDRERISAVVEAAFGRPAEAHLVDRLRASEHFVPDLSLVAEEAGAVVGHVTFSYCWLVNGGRRRVLALAPVSVAPERQRQGIGAALINEGLRRANELHEPLVVVLGHPAYYPRFGFEPARPLGIVPPDDGIPDDAFMVRRLSTYRPSMRGRIEYPPAFDAV